MARKKDTQVEGQQSLFGQYRLPEARVRLKVSEGEALYSPTPMDSPEAAVKAVAGMLQELDREYVCVANLDNHLNPINYNIVSIGDINSAQVPVSNVFKSAILSNASSIIMFHCHPSGDPSPSKEDFAITSQILKASKVMDIRLMDHIIVGCGTGETYSFMEHSRELKESGHRSSVMESSRKYETKDRVKELTDRLEAGVKEVFSSEKYADYLRTMSRFHNYSLGNTILIALQRPDATLVAGYSSWQRNFDRQVQKGEKGIQIIAPAPYKIPVQSEKKDPDTGKPIIGADGKPEMEVVQKSVPAFKTATVFDVSQTKGKPLPEIAERLTGDVSNYDDIVSAIKEISPVPIEFAQIHGGANGYYSLTDRKIVVQEGMSEEQTIKTSLHELAHSMLHSDKDNVPDQRTREVQAESIAFTVSSALGISTDSYSFGYITGWSSGRETPELKQSLRVIQETSSKIINEMERRLVKSDTEGRDTEESRDVMATEELKTAEKKHSKGRR